MGSRCGPQEIEDVQREYLRGGGDDQCLSVGVGGVEVFAHNRWLDCDIIATNGELYTVRTRGARVIFIDNVPDCVGESKYVEAIKAAIRVPFVCQDRFHVMHAATLVFNNHDSRYHMVATVKLRQAAFIPRAEQEMMVDKALAEGRDVQPALIGRKGLTTIP